ncbi:MAG: hypothetical protein OXN97_22505 [Bryobacterales bacterium]|nr:hypothetical protein [Bryobacterales bacterium]
MRRRCVLEGFEQTLNGKQGGSPPPTKLLCGEQEAELISLRLGPPPPGCGRRSLRPLARRVVELGITGSIIHEIARRS